MFEPACGRGAIADALKSAGRIVTCSDLHDYGYPNTSAIDFLAIPSVPIITQIVTNPPYQIAGEFVQHAVNLVPDVWMLLPLRYLAGARKEYPCWDDGSLARVLVFKRRLPRMHRDGWKGKRATSTVEFAWFNWKRGHTGSATVERIDW